MVRRTILLGLVAALAGGCGASAPATLTEKGLRELRSGKYDEAIATCTAAIVANPKDAEAYLYRGRAHQNRNAPGDTEQAIANFTQAIQIAPNNADAYYSRAIVYRDMGDFERALADDRAARNADHQLNDIYSRLPDLTTQSTIARVRQEIAAEHEKATAAAAQQGDAAIPASGDTLPKSEVEQKELYEKLKERFEPGFGTLRPTPAPVPTNPAPPSFGGAQLRESETLNGENREWPAAPEDSYLSLPLGSTVPSSPSSSRLDTSLRGVPPLPPSTAAPRQSRPLPHSPFVRNPQPVSEAVPGASPVASPFPQQAGSGTGFRGAAPVPAGSSPPPRQAPRLNPNAYSNPAVRPPSPRDYTP